MIIAPLPITASISFDGIASDLTVTGTGSTRRAPDSPHSGGRSVLDSRPKLMLIVHADGDHGLLLVIVVLSVVPAPVEKAKDGVGRTRMTRSSKGARRNDLEYEDGTIIIYFFSHT